MNGEPPAPEALRDQVHDYLRRLVPFGFSGACLISRGGKILLNEGYGMADSQAGIVNTAETVFSLGSITKQFTAAAILALEAQGRLRTEDPISRHLPGVPADKAAVTLHHLLTHSAGLVNYIGDDYEMFTREEALAVALEAPLDFAPGSRYAYSNAGYTLLAAVVELVSGQEYETFLRERFFEPAGMSYTGYRLPDWRQRHLAHFHVDDADQGTNLDKPFPSWSLLGNGEMLSTTGDMHRWHRALTDGALPPGAKEKLYRPFLDDYAYGWRVTDGPLGRMAEHGGATGYGSCAHYRRYLEADVMVMLFCNRVEGGLFLSQTLKDRIASFLYGEPVEFPPQVPPPGAGALAALAGAQRLRGGGRVHIDARHGHVRVLPQDQAALDAMFPGMAPGSEALNRKALEIVRAAALGDYEPLIAARPQGRPSGGARRLIETLLAGHEDEEVIVLGTTPSNYFPAALDTLVTTSAREQALLFIWQDGVNVGCGLLEGDARSGLAVPCLPLDALRLSGYHVGAAAAVRVDLQPRPEPGKPA